MVTVFCPCDSLEREEVPLRNSPSSSKCQMHLFAVAKDLIHNFGKSESLFCGYFESVWPTQKPNGLRTKKSCKIHEINKNATTLSRTRNEAQVHRLSIIVMISTFSFAIFGASHICNDSVMSNRSLTERKLALLCRRYVTPGTDEADIGFGNVALFLLRDRPHFVLRNTCASDGARTTAKTRDHEETELNGRRRRNVR